MGGSESGGLIPFNALKFNKSFFDGKPVLSDSGGRTGAIPTLDNLFQPIAAAGHHANQSTAILLHRFSVHSTDFFTLIKKTAFSPPLHTSSSGVGTRGG